MIAQDCDILAIPTVPGPPPKLQSEALASSKSFRDRSYFSFLSVAALSGFCQVIYGESLVLSLSLKAYILIYLSGDLQVCIPLGTHDDLPVSVSLVAKHDSDGFLLNFVETLYETIKEQVEIAEQVISS